MLEDLTADFKNVQRGYLRRPDGGLRGQGQGQRGVARHSRLSDYEYELQMAMMNRKLQPDLETVFMMPAEQYSYLSSRLVREVAQLGGAIERTGAGDGGTAAARRNLDPAIKLAERRRMSKGRKSMSPSNRSTRRTQTDRTNQPH